MKSIGIIALMMLGAGVYEAAVNGSDALLVAVATAIGLGCCLAALINHKQLTTNGR